MLKLKYNYNIALSEIVSNLIWTEIRNALTVISEDLNENPLTNSFCFSNVNS